jgi:hypothetical protein
MLPNFANVALNKEARNIVCKINRSKELRVWPVNGRSSWIVLSATDTSHCLVFFILKVITSIDHVGCFCLRLLVLIVAVGPSSPPRQMSLFKFFYRL